MTSPTPTPSIPTSTSKASTITQTSTIGTTSEQFAFEKSQQFPMLTANGMNYLRWYSDLRMHARARGVEVALLAIKTIDQVKETDTMYDTNKITEIDAAKALILIKQHIASSLQDQYINIEDPARLLVLLKERFNRLRIAILPRIRNEWANLRMYDYIKFSDFDAELHRIATRKALCGETLSDKDLIEKALSTMSPAHLTLSKQYRAMKFDKYTDLASYLVADEENDNLLLHNSQRPAGTIASPETHATSFHSKRFSINSRAHTHKHNNSYKIHKKTQTPQRYLSKYNPKYRKGHSVQKYDSLHDIRNNTQEYNVKHNTMQNTAHNKGHNIKHNKTCYRCGTAGHFANNCKTPAHLVELFQAQNKDAQSDTVDVNMIIDNKDISSPYHNTDLFGDFENIEIHALEIQDEVSEIVNLMAHVHLFSDAWDCKIEGILLDSGTTHTILKDRSLFIGELIPFQAKTLKTIVGDQSIKAWTGQAKVILKEGTIINVPNAVWCPTATKNLLSFKAIHDAGYYIKTATVDRTIVLYIMNSSNEIKETLSAYSSGLFYSSLQRLENYNTDIINKDISLWHNRLGHPGSSMTRRIIENTSGHLLKLPNVTSIQNTFCEPCAKGKLIIRPSSYKLRYEALTFLERIQGDICGPIHPPCGPFRYFLVLIDASTKWSDVSLLSSRNQAFARLLGHLIKLRAQFPNYPIKTLRLDGAGEFTSKTFISYCNSIGITLQHSVAHVHTQNGLAESFIKRLRLLALPMLLHSKLPTSAWGHAILHAAELVKIRPSGLETKSPIELATGQQPNIAHLRIFGCKVLVPIPPPNRTKMGPQRKEGIYTGFDSPSIIKYIELNTGNLFRARFADCIFNEKDFPSLINNKNQNESLLFNDPDTLRKWPDPITNDSENEVKRILYLNKIANELPDAFNNSTKVTKSHSAAANAPVITPIEKVIDSTVIRNTSKKRQRGPDLKPRKRRTHVEILQAKNQVNTQCNLPEIKTLPQLHNNDLNQTDSNVILSNINQESSISNINTLNQIDNITDSDNIISDNYSANIFTVQVADTIVTDDPEPNTIHDAKKRNDWPKWLEAIQDEINALKKRNVLGPIQTTPIGVNPVGCRWVFVRKRDSNNNIIRYKARLVAQGFLQRYGIDYEDTYSPVMDSITFRYLISLAVDQKFTMRLLDVVTAYLYGKLDTDIYMKVPAGLLNDSQTNQLQNKSVKLQRALYGLKQAGRMWYQCLKDFFLKKGYKSDELCPCIFIRKNTYGIIIVAAYVDDLNLIGTEDALNYATKELKDVFEMKDLGKTNYCLGQQIEHLNKGIFVHQTTYTRKILKKFKHDSAYPVSSPMVVRSLNVNTDPYRPKEENENILGPEIPYLAAIGALMYLANHTRPDIAFAVNLLARFSIEPTQRHWIGIKHIFRYLRGTEDLGLFYQYNCNNKIIGYADAGYLSDPHKGRSQTGYVFVRQGAAIAWKSTKQTLVATSSNHAELIALYEATRECSWLRSINKLINIDNGLSREEDKPTIIYEDNAACIAQLKSGYIKGDRTKHIAPKFFYMHDLLGSEIEIQKIHTCDNLADIFTKSLPSSIHRKMVKGLGMRRLNELYYF